MAVAWIEAPINNGRRLPTRLCSISASSKYSHLTVVRYVLNEEANVEDGGRYLDNAVNSLCYHQNDEACIRASE